MAESIDIRELNERIERQSAFVTNLTTGMDQIIVGQKHLVESLLIGLLSDGHVLLEGVPGLAKTLAIKTLASLIDAKYSRIQFTPDLLPADVVGTMVYSQKDESFQVKKGPIFANFVLADEINRAPAKVQSALLEAMQERQVTIGKETFLLPEPFLVLATQNPIEQEGTYPLPEAQVDRFMLKVIIDYPKQEEEKLIIRQNINGEKFNVEKKEPIREIPLDTVAKADTIVKVVAKTPNQQEIKQMSERVNVSEKVDKTSESESVSREKSTKTVSIPVKPDSVNYTITGTKATYTIKEGETLTRVSLRFYGTKDLWPYIVKHNRGVIKNPNNVPYGTVLKIPELVKK